MNVIHSKLQPFPAIPARLTQLISGQAVPRLTFRRARGLLLWMFGVKRRVKNAVRWILEPEAMRQESEEQKLEDMVLFRGQFLPHRKFQLELLKRMGLSPHHRVMEIGCGPLTLGTPLIAYLDRGRYLGIDARVSVLEAAYSQIAKQGNSAKNPRIIHSSTFGRDELEDCVFDCIVSFSVVFHLEDALVETLFQQLFRRLDRCGVFIANVNTTTESSRWKEFPFMKRPLSFYEGIARNCSLDFESLGCGREIGFSHEDALADNSFIAVAHRGVLDKLPDVALSPRRVVNPIGGVAAAR